MTGVAGPARAQRLEQDVAALYESFTSDDAEILSWETPVLRLRLVQADSNGDKQIVAITFDDEGYPFGGGDFTDPYQELPAYTRQEPCSRVLQVVRHVISAACETSSIGSQSCGSSFFASDSEDSCDESDGIDTDGTGFFGSNARRASHCGVVPRQIGGRDQLDVHAVLLLDIS